jgi:hypothetical protein
MALGLCIQFIDLSTRRNIEQTPHFHPGDLIRLFFFVFSFPICNWSCLNLTKNVGKSFLFLGNLFFFWKSKTFTQKVLQNSALQSHLFTLYAAMITVPDTASHIRG